MQCDANRFALWQGDATAWAVRGVTDPAARFNETVLFRLRAGDVLTTVNVARALGQPYLRITWLRFRGAEPGQRDEAIGISNWGGGPQDMTGWTVRSPDHGITLEFPAGFLLGPGERCYIYTGLVRAESCGGVSFNATDVWPDEGGIAVLFYDALALHGDAIRYGPRPTPRTVEAYLGPGGTCRIDPEAVLPAAIANRDPESWHRLTADVVALLAFDIHQNDRPLVILIHLPSNTQFVLYADGSEASRHVCDPAAERVLESVISDPVLREQALSLTRSAVR